LRSYNTRSCAQDERIERVVGGSSSNYSQLNKEELAEFLELHKNKVNRTDPIQSDPIHSLNNVLDM